MAENPHCDPPSLRQPVYLNPARAFVGVPACFAIALLAGPPYSLLSPLGVWNLIHLLYSLPPLPCFHYSSILIAFMALLTLTCQPNLAILTLPCQSSLGNQVL